MLYTQCLNATETQDELNHRILNITLWDYQKTAVSLNGVVVAMILMSDFPIKEQAFVADKG